VHTLADGDAVVALATGELDAAAAALDQPGWPGAAHLAGELAVQRAAAQAMALAVVDATLAARHTITPAVDVPGYLDLYPSARPSGW
jgi:putative pantetheine hydrolase